MEAKEIVKYVSECVANKCIINHEMVKREICAIKDAKERHAICMQVNELFAKNR